MIRQSFVAFVCTASLAGLASAQGVLFGTKVEERAKGELGVLVVEVTPGSPAEIAGIDPGDVITKLGDSSITNLDAFTRFFDTHKIGDQVAVTIRKYGAQGEEQVRQATLGKGADPGATPRKAKRPVRQAKPEAATPPKRAERTSPSVTARGSTTRTYLGIQSEARDGSLVIVEVFPETPAQRAGLKPDDEILEFDGAPRATSENLRTAIQAHKKGDRVPLKIRRDGKVMDVTAELGEASLDEVSVVTPDVPEVLRLQPGGAAGIPSPAPPATPEVVQLRREVEELRAQLAELRSQLAEMRAALKKK
jgi:S1-C subfamily serine protease